MRSKRIRVVERKLGRERSYGQAYAAERFIEIDPRQDSRCYLDTLLHEGLHVLFPDLSESKIRRCAAELTRIVWEKNFRRVAL